MGVCVKFYPLTSDNIKLWEVKGKKDSPQQALWRFFGEQYRNSGQAVAAVRRAQRRRDHLSTVCQ